MAFVKLLLQETNVSSYLISLTQNYILNDLAENREKKPFKILCYLRLHNKRSGDYAFQLNLPKLHNSRLLRSYALSYENI
jgi:hypothetical protein